MNDLYAWVAGQHHGLRTFKAFQQKLDSLSNDEPDQRGLCKVLSGVVGRYVEALDEQPVPVELADRAHRRCSNCWQVSICARMRIAVSPTSIVLPRRICCADYSASGMFARVLMSR